MPKPPRHRAVGILTGGGDCPGLDAVIRAATRTAIQREWAIYGIENGFDGLLRQKMRRLNRADVRGALHRSGTILGATRELNPFEYPTRRRRATVEVDRSAEVVRNVHALGLAGLIVVGGEGTLALAERFHRRGVPIVGVPKAIDNDLPGTALSFGFDTAVTTAAEALDKLHPAAEAERRVMVVEVRGRNAGWIALHAGIAGGADVILITEIPFTVESVARSVRAREKLGREFSIVVVAEGATRASATPGRAALSGGAAEALAADLAALVKRETRSLALTHLQRGGSPTTFDRLLATRFGAAAMRLVDEGRFGNMVALKPPVVAAVPLHQAVGRPHRVPVDSDVIQTARDVGIGFGD